MRVGKSAGIELVGETYNDFEPPINSVIADRVVAFAPQDPGRLRVPAGVGIVCIGPCERSFF